MAIAEVAKINITVDNNFQEKILSLLQKLGFIEIEEHNLEGFEKINLSERISEIDYQIAGIKFSLDFLTAYDKSKKTLADKMNPKIVLKEEEINSIIQKFNHEKVVVQVQEVESQLNENKNQIEKYNMELEQISPWEKLDYIPNSTKLPKGFLFALTEVNKKVYSDLVSSLQKKFPISIISEVESTAKEVRANILYKAEDESKLSEFLNSLNIKLYEMPELEVKVDQRIIELKDKVKISESNIERIEKDAMQLSQELKNLKIIYDYLNWQKDKALNQQKMIYSKNTFSLLGWIDIGLIAKLEIAIEKITKNYYIEKLPINKEESIPIIFKNKWAKSFEFVTNIYGAPLEGEPDPTPFLAPFFTLFFGLALTDAGYGIVLAVFSLLAIRLFKIPKTGQKLFRVLFWGGVASFVIGFFTGGWFALDLAIMPEIIQKPLMAVQIINPLESPLTIFYLALGLGVVQVLFGLGINTWWKIKNNMAKEGLLTSGLWMVTIISLLVFAGSSMGLLPGTLAPMFKWLTLAFAIAIVLAKASMSKNFFLGLPVGVLALYNIVGYFSDVLSYSRLLALGLTTGIIGMVVNIITGLVMGIPWVGWLIGALVFIGGHIFNLGINALGAFIHSGRLQFIEFFPKFMEGGGKNFQPLTYESEYVRIVK